MDRIRWPLDLTGRDELWDVARRVATRDPSADESPADGSGIIGDPTRGLDNWATWIRRRHGRYDKKRREDR